MACSVRTPRKTVYYEFSPTKSKTASALHNQLTPAPQPIATPIVRAAPMAENQRSLITVNTLEPSPLPCVYGSWRVHTACIRCSDGKRSLPRGLCSITLLSYRYGTTLSGWERRKRISQKQSTSEAKNRYNITADHLATQSVIPP